jgi:hypothetical protein
MIGAPSTALRRYVMVVSFQAHPLPALAQAGGLAHVQMLDGLQVAAKHQRTT